ncbi:MAG: molybdenum cofactor guanylyltransferase [Planctomycetota bacterium]|nr:molybdenum cofactor guanylyltransferase [Planctomycetota bacterium]
MTTEASGTGRPSLPERSSAAPGTTGRDLLGLALAGGRSERMGRSKALMAWGDGRMIDACVRALAEVSEDVLVAGGDLRDLGLPPGRLIPDAVPGAGPLGAIVAGLTEAERRGSRGVLVLACDMPLVTRAELEPLTRAVGAGADAALWRVDGVLQPLCAAYASTLAPSAREVLAGGARRPVALFAGAATDGRPWEVETFEADQNSAVRLMNVNTERDYDRARRRHR